ncbi:hypothetical protein TcCL_NonESM05078 [Trypanosoma cruzi]|nr:hypothetical protein TcCL_NonESM05078 [Trypanosoma cruzi]
MDAARGCQDEPHVCGGPQCSGQVESHPHSPPLTKGQRHGEKNPVARRIQEGTRRSTAIHIVPQTAMRTAHTHDRNKRNEAHPSPPQSFTYPSPEGIALRLTAGRGGWRPTLTVRHGAHHQLPSERTYQGAQSPSHHRNGGTQTIVVTDHRCF